MASERAGQARFICLDSSWYGQYAIKVPCLKPVKQEGIHQKIIDEDTDDQEPNISVSLGRGHLLGPWEVVVEDDRAAYSRVLDACYQFEGK